MTGTDEHGQKIERKAKDAGVTPREYVDKIVTDTKELWNDLGITYDKYIRTTDEEHVECVKKIFENYIIREIFINLNMKDYIVLHVSRFGLKHKL